MREPSNLDIVTIALDVVLILICLGLAIYLGSQNLTYGWLALVIFVTMHSVGKRSGQRG